MLGTMSSAIFKISLLSSVCIVKVDFCGQLWTMGQGVKSMQKSKVPRFVLQMYLCSCNVVQRGMSYVLLLEIRKKRKIRLQANSFKAGVTPKLISPLLHQTDFLKISAFVLPSARGDIHDLHRSTSNFLLNNGMNNQGGPKLTAGIFDF